MRFSYLDIFMIGGLALGGYLGYRGGLAKKLFNILMLLFAVVAASELMTPIGDYLIDAGMFGDTTAYAVAFALVMLVIMVPARLLYRKVGNTGAAKTGGNTVGIVRGVLEGAMVISFILLGMRVFDAPEQEDRQQSLLYKPLFNFVPRTFDLLQSYFPGASEFKKQITTKFKDLEVFGKPPHPPGKP